MAWVQRGRKRYYYQWKRVGGKPHAQYLGTGSAAELVAAAVELRQIDRETQARQQKEERARHEKTQAPLRQLCQVTDVLARASLVAAGFYRHDRGEWRHRRGNEVRE